MRNVFLLFTLLLSISFYSFSQNDTEFWFVAPTATSAHGNSPVVFRFAAGTTAATVTISMPANGSFVPIVTTVAANSGATVDMTPYLATIQNEPSQTILNKGIRITSTATISAYYEVNHSNNPEIYAMKGQNALGTSFITPFQSVWNNGNYNPIARSSIDIVATEDNTVITINNTGSVQGFGANSTITVTLNRGQTYSVVNSTETGSNTLSGTRITSTKPVAVTIKDDSLQYEGCLDLTGDQMIPTNIVGTEYIVVKGSLNVSDKVVIVPLNGGTDVKINGASVGSYGPTNAYEYSLTGSSIYIETSSPAYVYHYTGFGCELGSAIVPPIKCTGAKSVYAVRSTNEYFGIIVFTPTAFVNDFVVNGSSTLLTAANFTVVPGTSGFYSSALVDMSANVAAGNSINITNPTGLFHAGIINGGASSGCRYGFFSDYSRIELETNIINPISCFNGDDGAIEVEMIGGISPYTYLWSDGQTTQTAVDLSAGTYQVIVEDASKCIDSITRTITHPAKLISSVETEDIINVCVPSTSTGAATVTVTGGTPDYQYSFDSNNSFSTSETGTGLVEGNHYVIVKDDNDCRDTTDFLIIEPPSGFALSAVVDNSNIINVCVPGNNTGSVVITVTNGFSPYQYSLNGGTTYQTGSSFTGLAVGTYTATVRDANGCIETVDFEIEEPVSNQKLEISAAPNDIVHNCSVGGSTGSVTTTVVGGYPVYEYTINGSSPVSSGTFTGLAADNYRIIVTDDNGCKDTLDVTIMEPPVNLVSVAVESVINNCSSSATEGVVILEATGGYAPYTFSNDNVIFQSGNSFSDLSSGVHTFYVKDSIGCTNNVNATITALEIDIAVVDASCGLNDGSASASISGGSGKYRYTWSTGAITTSISNLAPGTYSLTIEDSTCTPSGIELVTNGNFESGNTGFTSDYMNSANLYGEGTYAVGSNATSYHGSFSGTAHGGTGNFLIVNGASTAGTDVWCQTISVNPGTNYNFSAWLSTVNYWSGADVANLQFSINGVQLGSVFQASQSLNNWERFFEVWNSGTATSAQICIVNQNIGASGNDFGLDDISFVECSSCKKTETFDVDGSAKPDVTISSTDVSCHGGSDGEATAIVTSGTPTYIYNWDNSVTTATASGLTEGEYTVIVTDANGCKDTATVNISEPLLPLTMSVVRDSITHNCTPSGSAGIIKVAASGGTATYSYSIDGVNFQSSHVLNGLSSGTYTVTVRDSKNCLINAQVIINDPPTGSVLAASVPNDSLTHNCFVNGTDGLANVSATGGYAPYEYSINGGTTYQPSHTFTGLSSGAYTVTVRDTNNCTVTATFTIVDPANNSVLTASIPNDSLTHNCFVNGTDGIANVSATGGYAPYEYSINGGTTYQPSHTFTGLTSGAYTVTVRDTNNCTVTATFTIVDPANNSVLTASIPNDSLTHNCFVNGSDGIANVSATGGYAPYEYSINGGTTYQPSHTFTGLVSGAYTVTVRDTNNCTVTASFTIVDPANNEELDVVALPGNLTHNCFVNGSDGSATLTATGGYAPYTYVVTGPNSYNTTQVANPTFTNLLSGTYSVTVSDTNGCSATTTFQINDPANNEELDVVALPGNLTHNCFVNGSDGSATLTATGGYAPYTYVVTGPNSYNTTQVANPTFTNLLSGTYNVTVSDTNGCSATTTFQINDPANSSVLAASVPNDSLTHNCFVNGTDGIANISATGGYAPYEYSINGGTTYQPSHTFSGLVSGAYTVTVRDTNNCTVTATFTIVDPANNSVLIASVPNDSLTHNCFVNGSDGIANVSATGGYAPYEYSINGGTTYQPSHTFTGLFSGAYTVTVRDTNNCTVTATFTIVDPANNSVLTASIPNDSLTHNCFVNGSDGIANVSATGGYAPYEYSINGGTTYQPSHTFTGLSSGAYTVTVRDTNNCTVTATFTIVDPANNSVLTASIPNDSLTHNCFVNGSDGIANVSATGGYAPYEYSINGGTTYQPSHTFAGLVSGAYTVTVRDTNNCTVTATFIIVDPANNSVLTASVPNDSLTHNCFVNGSDGIANVSATGGYAPYEYSINGGTTYQPSHTFTGLVSGAYTVTVRDTNNCTVTASFTIVDPANNEELDVVALPGNLTHNCFVNGSDGSATLTATGGYAPYTYVVTGPNSYNMTQIANPTFTNLLSGTYNVTVSDTNGCSATTTFQINDPANNEELDVVALSGNLTHNCFVNGSDGSATLTATGGYAPYTYVVTGPNSYNTTQVANPTFTNLLSGTYNVTVSDTNGCSATTTFQINDPANNEELDVVALPGNLTHNCFVNVSDGSATLTATGGYAPYTYVVTGPNSYNTTQVANPTFTNLLSGTYNVTVSDTNGCSATTTFQINDPANNEELDVVALPGNLTHNCFVNGTDGSATLTATGGYAPYTYVVTGPNSYNTTQVANPTFTNLLSGTYNVTVSDTNGCSATTTFQINDPANSSVLAASVPNDSLTHNCFVNGSDGIANVSATGGYAPYEYSINGGTTYQPSHTFTGLVSGAYTVTVRDTNNCTVTATFTIVDPANNSVLIASVPNDSLTHNCFVNGSDGIANVSATGGYAPYEYSINGGTTYQPSHTFSGLFSGAYTVTVRDTNNCTVTASFTIVDPTNNEELDVVALPGNLTHNCFVNGSDGSATLTATGGYAPYTYVVTGPNSYNTTQVANPTFTNLLSGTYTVTVSDTNGCSATTTFQINDPANNSVLTASVPNDSLTHNCFVNGTDGIANVSATGGYAPYEYSINGGTTYQPSHTFTGLVSGAYTVTVRDTNNCTVTASFTIVDPANNEELDVVALPGNLTHNCFVNGIDGLATLTATGGYAPYTYVVTGPNSYNMTQIANPTFTNLLSGTYNVTVSDTNGCSTTTTFQINDPANNEELDVVALPGNLTHNCFVNGTDGSATLTATGGYAPYTYVVTGPNSYNTTQVANPTFTNLLSGTYNVTVSDTNGCSTTTTFQINDPANNEELDVVALPGNLTHNCFVNGSDGSATLTATGGYAPYTYVVTGPNSYNTTQVANPTFTNLLSGTYNVTVSDTNGCSATTTFQINDPANNEELDVVALPGNLTHNCFVNGTDGSATLTATGGYAPYTYVVTGPNSYNTTQVANPTFTNLLSGTYNVTVSDTNGCSATTTFQINDPANNEELGVVALPGNLTHNCFVNGSDGLATLTATGGYAPYTYVVTGPNSYNTTQVANPTFTNLLSGTYNVTVSDTNGCSATTTFQINDPANNEELDVVALPGNLTHNCFVNGTDGSATLTATGGYAPYTYVVTGPNSYNTTQVANPTFTNLLSGTYNVTVSDTNGCSTTTTFQINDPTNGAVLTATVPSDSLIHNCVVGTNTGVVSVAATGGFAPYTYQLASGTPQISNTFTGLAAGNYNITVADTNGCTSTVTFTILEPTDNLTLTIQTGSVIHNCVPNASTGSAVLVAAGGYGSYSYVLDAGTAQTQGSFTNLTTGNHTVVVTDLHGCTATQTFYISNPPSQQELTATVNPADVLHNCIAGGQAGQAAVSALYGFPPYTYTLNGGTPQISSVFPNLASGNYSVIVTDSNGCQKTVAFTINDPLNGQELAVSIAPQNIVHICVPGTNTGSVTVTAANGFPSYVYSLNGGANQTSNVFNNLSAGNYTVTVTDQNGCLKTASFVIEQPTIELAAQIFLNNVTHVCVPGQNTGSFEVSAYGGFAPLTYSFNGGAFTSNNMYTDLFAGTYTVTVKDAHNCTKDVTVTITNPPSGNAISTSVNELDINHNCIAGQSSGIVKVTAVGGYTPYRYAVAGGAPQISNIFTGLATGTYNITVIDANGCEAYVSATVKDNDLPQIHLANADSNGCAPLTLTFDKNEYNYLSCNWLINGDTVNRNCNDMEYTFNTPGCYQVQFVGQGQTRCYSSSNMVTICVSSRPIASFTPSSYEVNSIENVIYFNNTSQNADYYNWSFGDFTPDATTEHVTHTFVGVEHQNFTVILTAYTETGCADTAAVRFTMKEGVIFFVPNAFTPDGDNFNNVFKPIITEGIDLTSYNLLLFDRWGEVIFESNDLDYGWDGTYLFNGGKLCQDGTYVWKIRFKKKGLDDIIEKTGHVTLVR